MGIIVEEEDSHYYGGGYAWRLPKKKRKADPLGELKSATTKAKEKMIN